MWTQARPSTTSRWLKVSNGKKDINSKTVCGFAEVGKQRYLARADFSGAAPFGIKSRRCNTCHCEVNLLKIVISQCLKGTKLGSKKWIRTLRNIRIVLFRFKVEQSRLCLAEATPCRVCARV